ncbi:MAG: peptidoglycan DD-metalloendopeptidase family protein [Armatimonadetes bacterium]|nr:peptidoglycan DD-metalloendopeptidase family protein [Armatimonadota bacterium]
MRHLRHNRRLALLLAAVALVAAVGAQAGSSSRLRRLKSQKRQVQSKLRVVKSKQKATHNALVAAQQKLDAARARLRKARAQLRATRDHIAKVKKELAGTEARLQRHKEIFADRLRVLYAASQPSALGLFLGVTDYQDLSNRVRYAKMVADADHDLLMRLVQFEAKLAERKAELARLYDQQAIYHQQVEAETKKVAQEEYKTRQVMNSILKDRRRLEAQLAALDAESKRIESMLRSRGSASRYQGKWSGTFVRPVPGRITSGFGMRMHPILHYRRMHTGVDFHASYGTPVRAADKGLVVYAGWRGGYGKCIILDHGSGIATLYGHLSRISVSRGQIVKRGAVIGAVGSTGLSTGPHLHFEVRKNGRPVNPLSF